MSLVMTYFWRYRSYILVSCSLISISIIIISLKRAHVVNYRIQTVSGSGIKSEDEGKKGSVFKGKGEEEVESNRRSSTWWTMFYDDFCRLVFNNSFSDYTMVIPDDEVLQNKSLRELACLYNRYLSSLQTLCARQTFLGQIHTGGVMVCSDAEIKPNGNVLFFEHELPDFQQFLYDLVARFRPNVTYFYIERPMEMKIKSSEIVFRQFQGTLSKEIDETVLSHSLSVWMRKVSIKELEIFAFSLRDETMTAFEDIISSSAINHIRILVLKIHYYRDTYTKAGLARKLISLRKLYKENFRIYWFDRSFHCAETLSKLKFNNCYTVCLIRQRGSGKRPSRNEKLERTELNTLPLVSSILKLNESETVEVYQNYLTTLQFHCKQFVRVGAVVDGGWEICIDYRYAPRKPCLVYSFGINDDWSFDEEMSNYYQCEVCSFDPSLGLENHTHSPGVQFYNIGISSKDKTIFGIVHNNESEQLGKWDLRTFQSILFDLGHLNRTIDIIKMDIESTEWEVIPDMISSGLLHNVKQLLVEFHGEGDGASLQVLRMLYEIGFRIYWMHRNPACQNDGHLIPICRCFEIYFVNTSF